MEVTYPVRSARQPTQSERIELERMTQQEVGRVALRAQLVLLSARQVTVPEIADIQQISDVTVYKWLDRFDAEGPAGLYDRDRSGRPPKVDRQTEQAIEETLLEPPPEQGYNFTYWTIPLLGQHLQQTLNKGLCHETIRTTLHRLDFRWRRPRWAVQRTDPQTWARMQAIGQAVFRASTGTRILLEDETILKTLPPLRRMWMRLGQQLRIPTPHQNDDLYLYGVLDLHQGHCFHACYDKGNSQATIAYLEQLLEHYPSQAILLIWDQARYHTSRLVQDWLADQPRLTTMLLPKYAADLNPIESIWRQLKNQVAANLTRSLEAIQDACHLFFEQHRPSDLLRMAGLLANS